MRFSKKVGWPLSARPVRPPNARPKIAEAEESGRMFEDARLTTLVWGALRPRMVTESK